MKLTVAVEFNLFLKEKAISIKTFFLQVSYIFWILRKSFFTFTGYMKL